jgi:gliding motility-associated-like protein
MLLSALGFGSSAQMINNDAGMYIDTGAIVSVGFSLHGAGGAGIVNEGKLYVSGDIVNNASADFMKRKSTSGSLILNGLAQNIRGKQGLTVYNLVLLNPHIKSTQVNLFIENDLALNNSVLNIKGTTVHIENSDTTAISRTTGYVATQDDATLSRNIQKTKASYEFPLGYLNEYKYQPVHIVTNGNDDGSFSAGLYTFSPSFSGMSTSSKNDPVGDVNESYYYAIERTSGRDSASIDFFINPGEEGGKDEIGTWDNNAQMWSIPFPTESSTDNTYADKEVKLRFTDPQFTHKYYTTVNEHKDTDRRKSRLIQIPNSFTANGDGLNDFWEIKGIEKFPDNHVILYNRWGEVIFDTKGYSNDNSFDASSVMQGVYMYVVEIKDGSGYRKIYNGDLTVLR